MHVHSPILVAPWARCVDILHMNGQSQRPSIQGAFKSLSALHNIIIVFVLGIDPVHGCASPLRRLGLYQRYRQGVPALYKKERRLLSHGGKEV